MNGHFEVFVAGGRTLTGGDAIQWARQGAAGGAGEKLEFDNFDYWIDRFAKYPMVQLMDLDAAREATAHW